jgi:hypothetical protein
MLTAFLQEDEEAPRKRSLSFGASKRSNVESPNKAAYNQQRVAKEAQEQKLSKWKVAKSKLNDAVGRSVEAISTKLKSEEVIFRIPSNNSSHT